MVSVSPQQSTGSDSQNGHLSYTVFGEPVTDRHQWFHDGLRAEMDRRGHEFLDVEPQDVQLVFNFSDAENPKSFRRKSQGTFAVAVIDGGAPVDNYIRAGYPLMIRTLSNVIFYIVYQDGVTEAHFVTMEQGHYAVTQEPGQSDESFFAEIYERVEPLATSRLVINNIWEPNLPKELWNGNQITDELISAGKQLDSMDLLPAPFPVEELVNERDRRHIMRLYSIGGLSYGNLSARQDADTFWMSASGVNKGKLEVIGSDVMLVTDYIEEDAAMVISVPPDVETRRVSVDAIEHYMIYQEHPEVGAIIHIHAWMDDIESTHINFPCGTKELAVAVAELVRQAPDPSRAVIGLKNHGLTITGHSLPEIFARIEGKIIPQVPMS